jgi:hypothetical protein
LLHKWKKQYEEDPQYVFPGKGRLKEPDEEMRRLRKELAVTKEERDILLSCIGSKESGQLTLPISPWQKGFAILWQLLIGAAEWCCPESCPIRLTPHSTWKHWRKQ